MAATAGHVRIVAVARWLLPMMRAMVIWRRMGLPLTRQTVIRWLSLGVRMRWEADSAPRPARASVPLEVRHGRS